ncbi:MAG: protein-L-isoaspartate(D-aspartate) O-methyltransferase [Deltaproteobacteria bacterium]|nr:protein-L-isoaspartate(D-aspartate) O-methyltransferase [Deltaproteobacteria bacterium]
MVREQIRKRGIHDRAVLQAMLDVPRHEFVETRNVEEAYGDHPLPIGGEQTISQPYMVALMTQELALKGGENVLEIGTGSGYQTAILARIAGMVCTIERIDSLLAQAGKRLERMGYSNVKLRNCDGTLGWPEESPFQGIIVTAGAPGVPPPLLDQLDQGGRLVIPVGDRFIQTLLVLERHGKRFKKTRSGGCRFVPLLGEHGWEDDRR